VGQEDAGGGIGTTNGAGRIGVRPVRGRNGGRVPLVRAQRFGHAASGGRRRRTGEKGKEGEEEEGRGKRGGKWGKMEG